MAVDPETAAAARFAAQLDLEQLKLLFDYTKFHIGIYGTLLASIVAVRQYWGASSPGFLKITLVFFAAAGAAGGVVASHIPQYHAYTVFEAACIGLGPARMPASWWIHVEHWTFWIGILSAVVGSLRSKGDPLAIVFKQ